MTADDTFLSNVFSTDGTIEPDRLGAALRVTKTELAAASGLSRDAVSKTRRLQAPATQTRLREVAETINRILPRAAPCNRLWFGTGLSRSRRSATRRRRICCGPGGRTT
nr:hypothetical protein [uncultured Rhodopila sp.]